MGQKFLIVNTEAFSPTGLGKQKNITAEDLPPIVKTFLSACPEPLIILDESSKIKTNQPCKEQDKSTRTRLIKTLNKFGHRLALTGTLMSKSPLNLIDQYQFLTPRAFPENVWEFSEKYCVMETIRVGRGRRVLIPETVSKGYDRSSWNGVRRRLSNAYAAGGEGRLALAKSSIYNELGINSENLDWIIQHKEYTPFKNVEKLMKRVDKCTATVTREEAFDTSYEKFIKEPIIRKVEMTEEQERLYKQFVKLGFTDTYTLGKAAALELEIRLLDVLNGFNPVTPCIDCDKFSGCLRNSCPFRNECEEPKAVFEPLKENPKVDALMELIDEIDSKEQIVIWSARKNVISAVTARLDKEDISYRVYTGEQNDKERAEAQELFLNKKIRVIIANQRTCAYGINFMGRCNYEIYLCANNSVEEDYQSRNRLLRAEIKTPKYAYRLCFPGTVEERIYRSLALGKDLIDSTANTRDKFELGGRE